MKITSAVVLLLLAAAILPGCLAVAGAVVGGTVAAGIVHATGNDGAEVVLDAPWETAYAVCRKELIALGSVEYEDFQNGVIIGYVDSAEVEIELVRATGNTVRAEISARRMSGFSPAPATAQRLAFGVVDRLQVARGPVLGGAKDGSVLAAPLDPQTVQPATNSPQ